MPNINVLGKVISFPDSMSQDDISAAIQNDVLPQMRRDDNLARGVSAYAGDEAKLQGATFGWGIPAQAALTALIDKARGSKADFGDLYNHYKGVINNSYQSQVSRHPVAAAGDNIMGGVATAPALGALQPLAGAGLATRVGAGAATGLAAGTIAGAGNAETAGVNPAGPTLGGAALGTVLGAMGPGVAAAYQALRGPVSGLAGYASKALNPALDAFAADNVTPEQALANYRTAQAAGKPVMPADMGGQNVMGLGRGAVVLPGPARDQITGALNARSNPTAAFSRISGDIEDMAGTDPGQISNAYQSALPQPLPALRTEFARVPAYRDAFERARAALLSQAPESAPAPLYDAEGNLVRDPTVQDADLIKRAMNAQNAEVPTEGNSAQKAIAVPANAALDDFLQRVDAAAPDYATARGLAQRGIGAQGLLDTAQTAADSAAYPNITKAVAGTGASQGAKAADLLATFSPEEVAEFQARQAIERKMLETRAATLLGSNTAGKAADALNLIDTATQAHSVISEPVTGGIAAAARTVSGALLKKQNQGIAEGLFSTGKSGDDFLSALDRLYKQRMAGQNVSLGGATADAYTSSQDQRNSY